MLTSTLSAMMSCAALFLGATAAPLERRDVVAPPITYPTEGAVWTVGAHEKVTWDTSGLPPVQNITNKEGRVVLGWLEDPNDPYTEHIDNDHVLAKGFPITQGSVDVVVPAVEPKDNYILILFGDSGNISPIFSIRLAIGGGSSSSAAPSSSSPASSITTSSSTAATSSAPNTSLPMTVTTVVQTSTTFVPSSTTATSTTASGLSTSISVTAMSASSRSSSRPSSSSASVSASSLAAQTTPSGAGRKHQLGSLSAIVVGAMTVVLLV